MKVSKNVNSTWLFALVACLAVAIFARPAAADGWTGGQVCQPMNLDIALKGLQWRSEGVLNNYETNLWVVCPVERGVFDYRMDVGVRLLNFGNSGATVKCLWKITDASGETVRSRNRSLFLPANWSEGMIMENMNVGSFTRPQVVSVSCNLPPETAILFLGSESF